MRKLIFSFLVLQIVSAQTKNLGNPLILTPLIKQGKIDDAKKAAKVDLEDFQNVTSYAGYLTVDEANNGNLFFWFFPSTNNYAKDPVLLWLHGGPGSSNLFSIFTQNGPFIVENGTVSLREYSWTKFSSVLYIDQPVGTGFSFTDGDYVTNQTQVGDHLYTALLQFFTLFPELQKLAFYVTGDAGNYVPAISYTIFQRNPTADLKINLQGLAMENPFTDPANQLDYGPLLYRAGLIDRKTLNKYNARTANVIRHIEQGRFEEASTESNEMLIWYVADTGLHNVFNFLEDNDEIITNQNWVYFVTQDNVRKALHVGTANFSSFNNGIYNALFADISRSVAPWVSELLNNYRVLIYSGQFSVIDGYMLTVKYLENLNFSAAAEYISADRQIWRVDKRVAGYIKIAGNLKEVLIRGAGHFVSADKPKEAFELMEGFINNR